MIRPFVLVVAVAVLIVAAIEPADPQPCIAAPLATAMPSKSVVTTLSPTADPGPTERVIPVGTFPVPTAVSGAELAWPRYQQGETGLVSHYGSLCPSCVALPFPWGPGWKVSITGPGGTWTGVSNDYGPVRELHRVADLGVPIWVRVCGESPDVGLCTATVTVTGRAAGYP